MSSSAPLMLQANHPYQGNPAANQITFYPGTFITVKDPRQINVGGWTFGTISTVGGEQSGWFPSSYAQPLQPTPAASFATTQNPFAPAPVAPAPINNNNNNHSGYWQPQQQQQPQQDDDQFGFEGTLMGARSGDSSEPVPHVSSSTNNNNNSNNSGSLRGSVQSTASKVGGSVQATASKVGGAMASMVGRKNKDDSGAFASSTTENYGQITTAPPASPSASDSKKNNGSRGLFRRSKNNGSSCDPASTTNINTAESNDNRPKFFQPRQRQSTTETISTTTTTSSNNNGRSGRFGRRSKNSNNEDDTTQHTSTSVTVTTTTHPPGDSRAKQVAGSVGTMGTYKAAISLASGNVHGAAVGATVAAAGFAAENRME